MDGFIHDTHTRTFIMFFNVLFTHYTINVHAHLCVTRGWKLSQSTLHGQLCGWLDGWMYNTRSAV